MSTHQDSPALAVARAHVEAWSSKDWDAARSMLAPDVHVIAMTTNPALPHTDLTGADEYMSGLVAFADPIVPGSVRELGSAGDERNALLTLDLRWQAARSEREQPPRVPGSTWSRIPRSPRSRSSSTSARAERRQHIPPTRRGAAGGRADFRAWPGVESLGPDPAEGNQRPAAPRGPGGPGRQSG
jgi:hypothetical protein